MSLYLFVGLKTSSWPWTSPTHFPLPNELFPSLVHCPWTSMCQPRTSFILYGNLALHHYLAPLAIILLCWAFSKIVYIGFMGLLCAIYHPRSNCEGTRLLHLWKGFKCTHPIPAPTTKGIWIILPPLAHTTMGSNTTCWGDKHLEKFSWIINITYRDTL